MPLERRRLLIQGAVQGVGFRPFIYRLAIETGVSGWVINSAQGVVIEAEAPAATLDHFVEQIDLQKPPHSFIQRLEVELIPPLGETAFEIRHSDHNGSRSTIILPDLATCPACLSEMLDPANRRYRYPFTNCTHCGPRYSIIERLPYDRPQTTMRGFTMCPQCQAEYEDPLDRRFHAQPNACPVCGPQLALWNPAGETLAVHDDALRMAARLIGDGAVVALKGIGGFQLLVDARSEDALRRLRERKHRPDKPLAIMAPTLDVIRQICEVSDQELALLTSSEAPIVLLERLAAAGIAPLVAPGNPNLGVMLPYTPLHHLLMAELGFPVVATSGNLSGEPICTDEREALARLSGIADVFLVHNRPIARPVDDSVVRVMAGGPVTLRRARGYAPLPLELPDDNQPAVVAVGAHLKNTIAVSVGRQVFLSQHIGDLESPEAVALFKAVLADLQQVYEQQPALIACDLHPDYQSTRLAEAMADGLPLVRVQHHYAHVLACMAEHRLSAPVLGVAWDGTGYGTDGTIWGGEFMAVTPAGFERPVSLRPFRLPGGESAIREPRRIAFGLLWEAFDGQMPAESGLPASEAKLLASMLSRGVNSPLTSSMGRFFDAVAALLGLRTSVSFEGQAAMDLEFACQGITTDRVYPFEIRSVPGSETRLIDYAPIVHALLADRDAGIPVGEIAAAFHNTLVAIIAAVAERAGIRQIALTGGCFQNKLLLEGSIARLRAAGLDVFWPQKYPPNDGGVALGQVMAALRPGAGLPPQNAAFP